MFSKCLLRSSSTNTTGLNTTTEQCPSLCYLCYSSTACFECNSGYYTTQALTCVNTTARIWAAQQVDQVSQLIIAAGTVGAGCDVAAQSNQTLSFPFSFLSNISSVQLSNSSVLYVGSTAFNVSGVTLTYGAPVIYSGENGTSPNRVATVSYRNTDCMSNELTSWAAAFYENRTDSFELSINRVPSGAERVI